MLTNWNPARMPEKDEMKLRLSTARKQLYDLQMKIKEHKIPVIVLFEGWGTSGKGSTIGKVIRNIDPRFFKVVTMSEPTDEELRYPFLYRFFKEIPEAGKFTFLDSGWLEQICREHLEGKTDEKEYLANEFCGSFARILFPSFSFICSISFSDALSGIFSSATSIIFNFANLESRFEYSSIAAVKYFSLILPTEITVIFIFSSV